MTDTANSLLPWDALVTFVYTTDLDAMDAFYMDLCGLELALDQGSCHIYKVRHGAYLGVCQCEDAPDTSGVIVTLVSDAVDAWYEAFQRADIPCEDAPKLNERFGIYHFFARDPAGWRVEIQRFVAPPLPGVGASGKAG